ELLWVRRRGWRSRRERIPLADVAVYRARESRDRQGGAAVLRAGEHVMLLKLARTPEQVDAYSEHSALGAPRTRRQRDGRRNDPFVWIARATQADARARWGPYAPSIIR